MLKSLPYNALRTLESVVRLRGFGRAAEELNVTQSAVSQHVKMLEDWLGLKLLKRTGRQTLPTEAGEHLAAVTNEGFAAIAQACEEFRKSRAIQDRGILVASPPGFAFTWLLPRLLSFDENHPEIPVSLSTDPKSRDLELGDADVFISYSAGGFPGMHAEKLMGEHMSPVCSPQIASELADISDLGNFVVLEDTLEMPESGSNWDFWAKETGVSIPRFSQTRRFGQANLVIQAAISGLGVAMGRSTLTSQSIKNGDLIYPFPAFAHSQFAYWLVCRHEILSSMQVQAFRSWLHAEADKHTKTVASELDVDQ